MSKDANNIQKIKEQLRTDAINEAGDDSDESSEHESINEDRNAEDNDASECKSNHLKPKKGTYT